MQQAVEFARIAVERRSVGSKFRIDRPVCDFSKFFQGYQGGRRQQPRRGSDDANGCRLRGRARKFLRVCEFSAKIQTADETEDFAERSAGFPQALGKLEPGV